ncbi:MAG: shikimate dehydrogenase [Gammaproteobacteria bacterium]
MSAAGTVDRYGLVGHPVSHSRSPWIHRRFAEQTGQQIEFELIDVEPGNFEQEVTRFRRRGGRGLNVTLPYKHDAFRFSDRLSERAQLAEAVNTLAWQADGEVFGDNTDGAGLVKDLQSNLDIRLRGLRVLLLGAGGAARGALGPLSAAQPDEIIVANRTSSRAVELARRFAPKIPVRACDYADLDGCFDLIINATSASLNNQVPPLPDGLVGKHTVAYDMMYQAEPTAFMNWATRQGAARVADGVGMLVEQAAESFRLWRGVSPETLAVRQEIHRLLR